MNLKVVLEESEEGGYTVHVASLAGLHQRRGHQGGSPGEHTGCHSAIPGAGELRRTRFSASGLTRWP